VGGERDERARPDGDLDDRPPDPALPRAAAPRGPEAPARRHVPGPLLERLPSAAAGNFAIEIRGAKPNALAVLYSSPATDTRPFAGAKLYLAAPMARVATFHLDATGAATLPVVVTPAMAGTELQYQAIFRDLGAVANLGSTNALHVEFCQ
jgi:hypothetical protein